MKSKQKIESKYNFLNINHSMVIPENSRVEKRMAKTAGGGGNFNKKRSVDGKLFQTRCGFYKNAEASQSQKHLKGIESRKQLKSVSNSKKKHKLQNSFQNVNLNTRVTDFSNEKPKAIRNDTRLKQIA